MVEQRAARQERGVIAGELMRVLYTSGAQAPSAASTSSSGAVGGGSGRRGGRRGNNNVAASSSVGGMVDDDLGRLEEERYDAALAASRRALRDDLRRRQLLPQEDAATAEDATPSTEPDPAPTPAEASAPPTRFWAAAASGGAAPYVVRQLEEWGGDLDAHFPASNGAPAPARVHGPPLRAWGPNAAPGARPGAAPGRGRAPAPMPEAAAAALGQSLGTSQQMQQPPTQQRVPNAAAIVNGVPSGSAGPAQEAFPGLPMMSKTEQKKRANEMKLPPGYRAPRGDGSAQIKAAPRLAPSSSSSRKGGAQVLVRSGGVGKAPSRNGGEWDYHVRDDDD